MFQKLRFLYLGRWGEIQKLWETTASTLLDMNMLGFSVKVLLDLMRGRDEISPTENRMPRPPGTFKEIVAWQLSLAPFG